MKKRGAPEGRVEEERRPEHINALLHPEQRPDQREVWLVVCRRHTDSGYAGLYHITPYFTQPP